MTNIDEQNIAEIINLKEFSKPMIDLPLLEKEKDDGNRQNFLSLIDRIIFQKWHTKITLVINKEFSLTKIALIDSSADMNCIEEGLIPLKYYEKSSERLTQVNGEKLIINYKIPNVHICNDEICFETIFGSAGKVCSLRLTNLGSIPVASRLLLVGYCVRDLRGTQVRVLAGTSVVLVGPVPHMVYTNLGGIIQP